MLANMSMHVWKGLQWGGETESEYVSPNTAYSGINYSAVNEG